MLGGVSGGIVGDGADGGGKGGLEGTGGGDGDGSGGGGGGGLGIPWPGGGGGGFGGAPAWAANKQQAANTTRREPAIGTVHRGEIARVGARQTGPLSAENQRLRVVRIHHVAVGFVVG